MGTTPVHSWRTLPVSPLKADWHEEHELHQTHLVLGLSNFQE